MTLTNQDFEKMEYFLGKSRLSYLTKKEESVLRSLIAKENSSANDSSLDDLIKLGLIIVGLGCIFCQKLSARSNGDIQ